MEDLFDVEVDEESTYIERVDTLALNYIDSIDKKDFVKAGDWLETEDLTVKMFNINGEDHCFFCDRLWKYDSGLLKEVYNIELEDYDWYASKPVFHPVVIARDIIRGIANEEDKKWLLKFSENTGIESGDLIERAYDVLFIRYIHDYDSQKALANSVSKEHYVMVNGHIYDMKELGDGEGVRVDCVCGGLMEGFFTVTAVGCRAVVDTVKDCIYEINYIKEGIKIMYELHEVNDSKIKRMFVLE